MEKDKPYNILEEIECKGQIPLARSFPTATRIVLIVFGGTTNGIISIGDTYLLDLRT